MTETAWRWVLLSLGGTLVALAGWAALHPSSFTLVLANFGPANDHLVRDFAACAATFGLGLLLGLRVPGWRTFALIMAALWNGFHAISHLYDIDAAQPAYVGPIEAVGLIAVTILFGWLARVSAATTQRQERPDAR